MAIRRCSYGRVVQAMVHAAAGRCAQSRLPDRSAAEGPDPAMNERRERSRPVDPAVGPDPCRDRRRAGVGLVAVPHAQADAADPCDRGDRGAQRRSRQRRAAAAPAPPPPPPGSRTPPTGADRQREAAQARPSKAARASRRPTQAAGRRAERQGAAADKAAADKAAAEKAEAEKAARRRPRPKGRSRARQRRKRERRPRPRPSARHRSWRSSARAEQERAQREADLRSQLQAEEHLNAVQSSPAQGRVSGADHRAHQPRLDPPAQRARRASNAWCISRRSRAGRSRTCTVAGCNGDEAVRQSVETAAYRASPLPAPPIRHCLTRTSMLPSRPMNELMTRRSMLRSIAALLSRCALALAGAVRRPRPRGPTCRSLITKGVTDPIPIAIVPFARAVPPDGGLRRRRRGSARSGGQRPLSRHAARATCSTTPTRRR